MTKPVMRWYQLRLRTLVLGIALIAVALGAWSSLIRPFTEQKRLVRVITTSGGSCETVPGPGWLCSILGTSNCQSIELVDLSKARPGESLLHAISGLPAIKLLVLGGGAITDDSVRFIPRTDTLEAVIFDSTSVSDAAIAELRAQRAGVYFCLCDHTAIVESSGDYPSAVTTVACEPAPPPPILKRFGPAYFREITSIDLSWSRNDNYRHLAKDAIGLLPTMHRMQSLALRQDLSAEDIALIGACRSLRRLSIDRYWAHEQVDLTPLDNLTSLVELDLHNFRVTDDDLQALSSLQQLQALNLSDTAISGPSNWPDWPLRYLILDRTFIQDEDLQGVARYRELQHLSLDCTEVTDDGLASLQSLERLEVLDLLGTRITEPGLEALRHFPRLQHVAIGSLPGAPGNYFGKQRWHSWGWILTADFEVAERPEDPHEWGSYVSPASFEIDQQLADAARESAEEDVRSGRWARIDWAGMPQMSRHLEMVDHLAGVKTLRLWKTLACDEDMQYVASMPDLEYLDLSDTWVTDAGLKALTQCKNLKAIELSGTRITGAAMETLAKIKTLQEIELPRHLVGNEALLQLRQLPNLVVLGFQGALTRTGRQNATPPLSPAELDVIEQLGAFFLQRFDVDADGVTSVKEIGSYLESQFANGIRGMRLYAYHIRPISTTPPAVRLQPDQILLRDYVLQQVRFRQLIRWRTFGSATSHGGASKTGSKWAENGLFLCGKMQHVSRAAFAAWNSEPATMPCVTSNYSRLSPSRKGADPPISKPQQLYAR